MPILFQFLLYISVLVQSNRCFSIHVDSLLSTSANLKQKAQVYPLVLSSKCGNLIPVYPYEFT